MHVCFLFSIIYHLGCEFCVPLHIPRQESSLPCSLCLRPADYFQSPPLLLRQYFDIVNDVVERAIRHAIIFGYHSSRLID